MQTFHGAWPALITPATPEGGIEALALRDLTEYLIGKQVDGFYLCGSTGEGLFQSVEERQLVVETVMDQVGGRVPVIVHVGCIATRDAVALAQHAQQAGAAGVSSVLPPLSQSPPSIFLHYEAIAAAVPDLPFFPYLFGGRVAALTLMQELLQHIPNVAGAKYTGPNMYEFKRIVDLREGGWTLFSGMDEQCLYAAMSGAPGNIGSTLNLMPGAYREIRARYEAGDVAHAQEVQFRANAVTSVLHAYGFAGALREALLELGLYCGPPRLPTPPFPVEKRAALFEALAAVEWREMTGM
jgi:N-acetylneuraminate lyase